jgi:hypothetical protein
VKRKAVIVGLAGALLVALAFGWLPATAEESEVRLEIHVTAEESGEPIEGAAIYVNFKEERFLRRDKSVGWRVKTDKDGKAVLPPLPEGTVRVQIVAKGWKTYGEYHTLEGPKQVLEIKLKPPKRWY